MKNNDSDEGRKNGRKKKEERRKEQTRVSWDVGGEALRCLSPRQLTWTYKYSTGFI